MCIEENKYELKQDVITYKIGNERNIFTRE